MYMSAYSDSVTTWGTHSNIHINEAFGKYASPSDFLCQQSIADSKVVIPTRKRHQSTVVQRSGEGENDGPASYSDDDISISAKNHGAAAYERRVMRVNVIGSTRVVSTDMPCESDVGTDPVDASWNNAQSVQSATPESDSSDDDGTRMARDIARADSGATDREDAYITQEDSHEFYQACEAAPLYAAAMGHPHPLCSALQHAGVQRPLTQQQQQEDDEARQMVADSGHSLTPATQHLLTDEERLLLAQEKRGKVVPDLQARKNLMDSAHAAGHFGEKAMYAHIERSGYWWPRMRDDIATVIRTCRDCQRYNIVRAGFHPARSVTAARPADHYQMDLAKFSRSVDGMVYCLVIIDVFTGFIVLTALPNKTESVVARALWTTCGIIGVPRILQSDNGSEFNNRVVNALCRLTGINRRFIAPYNPRADGKVERAVKTIKEAVVKLLRGAAALWPLYLPFVQLMYNNKVQELTGSTPFALMFGRQLNELRDYSVEPYHPVNLAEWKEHQQKVVSLIFPAIEERITGKQAVMRKKLDTLRKKIVSDDLLPGTVVQIKDPQYLLHPGLRPTKEPMYIGPYTIVRRTLHGPYLLRTDTGEMYGRLVNCDHMKVLYSPKQIPAVSEDDNAYEVDYIVKHRETDGEYHYQVKWKGYDVKEATWETEEAFNDPQPVERYWKLVVAKQQAKLPRVYAVAAGTPVLFLTSSHSPHLRPRL
jgi:transposase InsO family protein